jgi:hypothetical protein
MCLCTGTSAPAPSEAAEGDAGGRRHGMAVCLAVAAALAVNLTASFLLVGS